MLRRAHHRSANQAAILDRSGQFGNLEPGQPGGEREVRVVRSLSVQPDKLLNRRNHTDPAPLQQQLALEGCAVERPPVENDTLAHASGPRPLKPMVAPAPSGHSLDTLAHASGPRPLKPMVAPAPSGRSLDTLAHASGPRPLHDHA
jgi:hypothetical protein